MAGAAIINIIGAISGALGIIQFGQDNFGSGEDKGGSVVRIQVGLDSDRGLNNAGGDLPDIRLFNEVGEFLGAKYAEQQATYGLFTANDDAICLAYLSIVWPDGQKFGWMGDLARACDFPWYYSNVLLDNRTEKLACMWIDKIHDQPVTAFQVHFSELVTIDKKAPPTIATTIATTGTFSPYYNDDPNTINFWVPNDEVRTKSKRNPAMSGDVPSNPLRPRRRGKVVYSNDTRLIMSSDVSHNAAELCNDPVSLGPDLNVAEGQSCQMSTKKLYLVTIKDNYFNVNTRKLVIGGISARDADYPKVIDWTGGSS